MKKHSYLFLFALLLLARTVEEPSLHAQTFPKDAFAQRRQRLMDKMDGGIAIFRSAKVANRNNDVDYEYRQDSDFYYLTGFEEPESAFLLIPDADKKFVMFVRPGNRMRETWTGKRFGVKGAMDIYGADTAYTINEFEKILPRYLTRKEKLYYSWNDKDFNEKLINIMKQHRGYGPDKIINPLQYVHEQRLIKSPEEMKLMRRAIDITCEAHTEAMKAAKPGMYEYELEAIIEYIYRKNGSPRPGFPSIVGSGPNSCIFHYEVNNRQTQDGDIIVIDIGAEYGYYSADVTRTIPVSGKFSREQRDIYEIVLRAQQEAIDMAAPGKGIREIQNRAIEVVKDGLYRLGLITDKNSSWQYRIWLMHAISHWLGLDVQDVGSSRGKDERGRILEPGMVFAVEPGIYVPENALDDLSELFEHTGLPATEEEIAEFVENVKPVAEKYRNIGVRIEDDVLITEEGHELLSSKAPRTIDEIENIMKKSSRGPQEKRKTMSR